MSAFRDGERDRLDFQLLQVSPVALYFKREVLEEDLRWLAANHYAIDRLDASSWLTKEDALDALAAQLAFPDYFGRNLDALNDCLRDLDVPDAGGRCVVFERYDAAVKTLGAELAWQLLDIFAGQARAHLLFGKRLLVLLQSDDPQLAFAPVGATPPSWNPREWLDSARRRDLSI